MGNMSTHNKKSVDHCHLEKRKATKTLMLVNFAVVNCCFASVLGTLKYIKLLWGIVGLSFNCWYVEWFLLKYLVLFDCVELSMVTMAQHLLIRHAGFHAIVLWKGCTLGKEGVLWTKHGLLTWHIPPPNVLSRESEGEKADLFYWPNAGLINLVLAA